MQSTCTSSNSSFNVNDTSITASISTVGAALGAYNVIVINPDGQQALLVNGFTVT